MLVFNVLVAGLLHEVNAEVDGVSADLPHYLLDLIFFKSKLLVCKILLKLI